MFNVHWFATVVCMLCRLVFLYVFFGKQKNVIYFDNMPVSVDLLI